MTEFSEAMLGELSRHAILTRYAGEEPTLEEARQSLQIAKTVRAFARKWLAVK